MTSNEEMMKLAPMFVLALAAPLLSQFFSHPKGLHGEWMSACTILLGYLAVLYGSVEAFEPYRFARYVGVRQSLRQELRDALTRRAAAIACVGHVTVALGAISFIFRLSSY